MISAEQLKRLIDQHPYSNGDASVDDLVSDILEELEDYEQDFGDVPDMTDVTDLENELRTQITEHGEFPNVMYRTRVRTDAELDLLIENEVIGLREKLSRYAGLQRVRRAREEEPGWWIRATRRFSR